MLLLEANDIKKFYGDRQIIGFDELKIYSGDRIGVTGLNGAGKTTLLDILSGVLEPDKGSVKRFCQIGYIRQFGQDSLGDEEQMEQEYSGINFKLLKEFKLDTKLDRAVLSGGEQTRLKIAVAIGNRNVLLFADEPTSNLDYKGIELLKQKLEEVDSFVMISHDRGLLDSLCNRIIEVKDGEIRSFNGNFTFYRQQCEMENERASLEYNKYIDQRAAIENAISNRKKRAGKVKKAPGRMGNSEARLHKRSAGESQEKLHKAANSLVRRLEKLEVKEKPREQIGMKLNFSLTQPPDNRTVISAKGLSFSYGEVQVLKDVGFSVTNGTKTALWGENGTGKTTLLNLVYTVYMASHSGWDTDNIGQNTRQSEADMDIRQFYSTDAVKKSVKSISIVPKARLAYFRQTFENLAPEESVLKNVMTDSVQNETTARTILARLLFQGDAVSKRVEVLSGGEKIKAAFAKLLVSRANVLLLDEPTNYLDMQSIEALGSVLKDYEGTVLFVSHDRAFVNSVANRLLLPGNLAVKAFDGGLEEYDEYSRLSGKKSNQKSKELERTMLQMKITEIISLLSAPNCETEALEEEYQQLTRKLKEL